MKNLIMLAVLAHVEKELPALLADKEAWRSLYIDYHPPLVERLYRSWGEYRIYLHKIHPCEYSAALFHPHNWPSAMRVVHGSYKMGVGYSKDVSVPPIATTLILPAGATYEMTDPGGWHYVRPLGGCAYSVMVTGKPWGSEAPKSDYPLQSLPEENTEKLLRFFQAVYP